MDASATLIYGMGGMPFAIITKNAQILMMAGAKTAIITKNATIKKD